MRVVHMLEGEVINEFTIKSKIVKMGDGKSFDMTASRYVDRITEGFEAKGHFVESGFKSMGYEGPYYWIIKDCGDNCIKVFPDDA